MFTCESELCLLNLLFSQENRFILWNDRVLPLVLVFFFCSEITANYFYCSKQSPWIYCISEFSCKHLRLFRGRLLTLNTTWPLLITIVKLKLAPIVLLLVLPPRWTLTTPPRMWPWGTWWSSPQWPSTWPRRGSTPWWRRTPLAASCGLSSTRSSWSTKQQIWGAARGWRGRVGRFQTAVSLHDNIRKRLVIF